MSNSKRRTWGTRRRTRSVGSMPFAWQPNFLLPLNYQTQSDEMCSSSTSKDKDCPIYYQSDSDDVCSSQHEPYAATLCSNMSHNMESDSFNENSPCRRSARRKRKFKRIAMEVEMSGNSRFYTHSHAAQSYSKKKRMARHSFQCPGSRLWMNSGKRKRSVRERVRNSVDGDSSDLSRDSKVLALSKLSLDDYPGDEFNTMEVSYAVAGVSSSSISSSGSETEIFTNDEGREGDDEQSDWIGDVGLATGGACNQNEKDSNTMKDDEMCSYQRYLRGNFETILAEDKRTCKLFPYKDDMRLTRRKIRTIKPNFSLVLPTDEKPAKFIPVLENASSKKREMDTDGGIGTPTRRHTFSGYKKRKRIPTNLAFAENVSDKSSELFLPGGHKLSDISSSDSKDSVQ